MSTTTQTTERQYQYPGQPPPAVTHKYNIFGHGNQEGQARLQKLLTDYTGSSQKAARDAFIKANGGFPAFQNYAEQQGQNLSSGLQFTDTEQGAAPPYAAELADFLKRALGGGGGVHIPGGGGISTALAHATHAKATHAIASLIDVNDPIYGLFAPENWLSSILSRGKEYTGSATDDALRLMKDEATRSGISTSSPSYLYMVAKQRRDQQQALANALRDAELAWTLPAADRRAGALGQNSSTATGVSEFNAGADNQVSMFNAGADNQTSQFNAGAKNAASLAGADLAQRAAQLGISQMGQEFDILKYLTTGVETGSTTTSKTKDGLLDTIAKIMAIGTKGASLFAPGGPFA